MFGMTPPLMGGDDGDSGDGGGGDRNTNVVEVVEKSFQSPGTTGRDIETGKRDFRRAISPASQTAAKAGAQFVGAMSGIPLLGTFLASQVRPTIGTDEFGNVLFGPEAVGGEGSGQGQFTGAPGSAGFTGGSTGGSFGGGGVASAADRAIERALGFTDLAAEGATQRIGEARTASLAALSPFAEAGTGALAQQQAFLGLSGPEAEQAALAGFTGGPGAQFAQQEEEQAIIRNALALGDVGGGRVRDELGRRAAGRFGTRLDTRLAQLGQVAGQGQQAAFGVSGVEQGTGINLANILQGTGETQASAVLGQEVAAAGARSEANRIAALQQQQQSAQDAAFQSQLFGLGASIAKPLISSFF